MSGFFSVKIMKKNIFIDTDMGNDDIMAIAYLLARNVSLVGISTVNGVATERNGINNLSAIQKYLKTQVPTCAGSSIALIEKKAAFPLYDSQRANDLTLLKALPIKKSRTKQRDLDVEEFIFNKTANRKTIILALGPLTNIAKTIQKYRNVFTGNVKEIFVMGGGLKRGNVLAQFIAEYNIFLDPEAAQIVFTSGIPITMIGIDATDYVPATKEFTEKVRQIKPQSREAKIIKEVIINNTNDFSFFYDPLSVFLLMNPQAIQERKQTGITVKLEGKNRGQTVLDMMRSNVNVVFSVDAQNFYSDLLKILERN